MAVYTYFSSNDIVLTQENQSFSVWNDNQTILKPSNYFGAGQLWFGAPDNLVNDTNFAASDRVGYTERNLGIGELYFTIYNGHYADDTSEEQSHITYANRNGSGSYFCNSDEPAQKTAISRMLYGQYRSLVYGDENTNFKFNGYEPQDIFVITFNRERYKQGLIPESLMWLVGYNPSNRDTYLTTDTLSNPKPPKITNIGRQYNVVSGSYGHMYGVNYNQSDNANKGSYGLFYPDAGIIILNPDALADANIINPASLADQRAAYNFNQGTGAENLSGGYQMFRDMISPSNTINSGYLELKAEETLFSQNYLIRIPNDKYNYTNNQTFVDENGKIKKLSFVDNPITYITTIGLYNDQNELLAVAKLSKPIAKDFSKELFIKVKLDF